MTTARRRPVLAAVALAAALYSGVATISPAAWAHVHASSDDTLRGGLSVVSVQMPGVSPGTVPDGMSGSQAVVLTVPRTGTPGPTAKPADPEGELPTWPFAVGAVVAVGAVALWSVRRRP